MKRKILQIVIAFMAFSLGLRAGNPDRQGEAGAAQLLINPWAKTAGMSTVATPFCGGVESFNLNIAGLGNFQGKTDIGFSNTQYLVGSGMSINALGLASKVGSNTFGVAITTFGLGDIPVTSELNPEGTGSNFRMNIFNLAIGYAHTFGKKVAVGFTARGVSEGTSAVSAFGLSMDAGIQYYGGGEDDDDFQPLKVGVALRNIGNRMRYTGQGLNRQFNISNENNYNLTFASNAAGFELPSVLDMGLSYDKKFGDEAMLTVAGNFTANSFSKDQISFGAQFGYGTLFSIRAGYRFDVGGANSSIGEPVQTGLAGGLSVNIPVSKTSDSKIGLDYGYQTTRVFSGIHNIGLRLTL
jgi:hypothetical protein